MCFQVAVKVLRFSSYFAGNKSVDEGTLDDRHALCCHFRISFNKVREEKPKNKKQTGSFLEKQLESPLRYSMGADDRKEGKKTIAQATEATQTSPFKNDSLSSKQVERWMRWFKEDDLKREKEDRDREVAEKKVNQQKETLSLCT